MIDDAKIGGITPAVLTFRGRWVLCPPYMRPPDDALGVLDRDPPLSPFDVNDRPHHCRP